MARAGKYLRRWAHEGRGGYLFFCPGCRCGHMVQTDVAPGWKFDGNLDAPTFTPSVKLSHGDRVICHSFVTAGKIQFLTDSRHALAGQTVALPEYPFERDASSDN